MFTKIGIKRGSRKSTKRRKPSIVKSFQNAQTIGIILDDQSKKDRHVEVYLKELGKLYKVTIITFTREKTNKESPQNIFSSKDFNWIGKISKNSIHKFVKTPFDFLISLNTSTILYVENVLALSAAKCRIGISTEENYPYLDFMIMTESSTPWDVTIKNIKQYTENIA